MAIIQDVYQLSTEQFQQQIGKVQAGYEGTAKGADKAATEGKKFGNETAKGAKQAEGELKKVEKQTGGLQTAFKKMGAALVAAFAISKVKQFLTASVEAADVQLQAEAKLRQALQGREDIMGRLTARASELQKVTTIGDEAIIAQQSFLAAQGRTEEQINKTIDAAIQLAAVTGTDLGSAVMTLDKTLEGNAGRLSTLDEGFKNLTAEQLKNGAGIDLIAEKYKGFAETAAKTGTGAIKQAQNAFGDLQEEIGKKLIPILASLARGFMFILDNIKPIISTFKVLTAGIAAYIAVTKGAAIAKKAYTAAVKLADIATKGFNRTMKASPIGLLVAGLVAAGVAISEYVKRSREAVVTNDELANSISEVQKSGEKEITQSKIMFERLKQTNAGSKERDNIMKKINETYGTTLKNMKSEEEFLRQIEDAQNKVIAAIKEKVAMRIQEAKYEDVITRQMKAQQALADEEQKLLDLQQKKLMATDMNSIAMNKLETEIKQTQAGIQILNGVISETENEMKSLDEETKKLTTTFSDALDPDDGNLPEAKRGIEELRKQVELLRKQAEDEAFAGFVTPETIKKLRDTENQLGRVSLRLDEAINGAKKFGEIDFFPDGLPDFADILGELPKIAAESVEEMDAEITEKLEAMFGDLQVEAETAFITLEEGLNGLANGMQDFSGGLSALINAIGDESGDLAAFTKALAIFDVAMKQGQAIAAAIAGATAAAAATGAGAPFALAGYIASMIGTVVAGFGQVAGILSAEPPRFFEGTASVERGSNPVGRDTIPALLNEGEAVIPTDDNRAYPGMSEAWIRGDLDRYIHKNWVAPHLKAAERERAERELNAIGQMMVQGFDDYRLHKDNREMIGVMRSGFNQLREGRKKVRGRV
jgi:hypothetical protein